MKSAWDANTRQDLLSRFEMLRADQRPNWGKMNPAQMVAHITSPIRTAVGDYPAAARPGPFRNPLLRYLVIYVLPWPKGAPTAPEYVHPNETDLAKNLSELRAALEKAATRGESAAWGEHPAFGTLPGKTWGELTYRHLDHHLKQFGL
ncbi:MAG: DUF1569 domain-containing protein [Acidobacteria bacterium]|nr:DUF1569 domain-containing protein [Acidobacteriota bacterium]